MSRSGYLDECEFIELYRASVNRAIHGKRGQAFLREMAAAMDEMPEKVLIAGELITADGQCCAIGTVCKTRKIDVSKVHYECPYSVADAVGIARSLAAEIEFINDDDFGYNAKRAGGRRIDNAETPEHRWTRMREWIDRHLTGEQK